MRKFLARRWLVVAAATVVVVFVAWLTICIVVVAHPRVNRATTGADAIIVLGEPEQGAIDKAFELARQGISDQVIFSIPYGAVPPCRTPPRGVNVTCFVPSPSSTQGEAEKIRALAAQHHWTHIVVITWPAHISRSRMLIDRCFTGTLQMIDYSQPLGVAGWLGEFAHQSGAYVKEQFVRNC